MLKKERILTPLAKSHTMAFPSCPAENSTLESKGCGSSTNTSSSCPCRSTHGHVTLQILPFIQPADICTLLPSAHEWGVLCRSSTLSTSGCWQPWWRCCHGNPTPPWWPWVWLLCPLREEDCTCWKRGKSLAVHFLCNLTFLKSKQNVMHTHNLE